ncbi:MAG: AMP-binding protein, partial [Flavobacteriales bacterium]|nr:AMP-binding protein [Flavobacteriales bacterium]
MAHPTALHAIADISENRPDAIAIRTDEMVISYSELVGLTSTIGDLLRSKGIEKDDVVVLLLPRGIKMALASISVMNFAICVPLNPDSTPAEISHLLQQLSPALIITDQEVRPSTIPNSDVPSI